MTKKKLLILLSKEEYKLINKINNRIFKGGYTSPVQLFIIAGKYFALVDER